METDGDSPNSKEEDLSAIPAATSKPVRVKIFPSTFLGPYVVYFRKKERPINVLLISAEVYKRYKSVKEIKKVSLDKLRVVFGSRGDANALLESNLFQNSYRVYAPCDSCEINGVIYDETLCCDDIINFGLGIFKNKSISPVKILDCSRLSKLIFKGNESKYIHSDCIKITFAGSVLPDILSVNNVTFDVRLYFPKLMHCTRCLLFGHTSEYCSNKPKCSKCGQPHCSSECSKHSDECIYCQKQHNSLKDCSVYKANQKKYNQQIKINHQLSYSEILKASGDFSSANIYETLSDADNDDSNQDSNQFIYKPPIKRKRSKVFF